MKNEKSGTTPSFETRRTVHPTSFSTVVKATALGAMILFLIGQWMQSTDSYLTEPKPKFESKRNQTNASFTKDFEDRLWPQLQTELCPGGTPKLSLGETLFKLARKELSITSTFKPDTSFMRTFFDDSNGGTLMVTEEKPSASLFYLRIFKCANNQIRDYLYAHFNQKTKKKRGQYRNLSSNSTASRNYTQLEQGKLPRDVNYALQELWPKQLTKFYTNFAVGNGEDDGSFRYKGAVYDKPCIFTVIRDPISHFLSGYNEIEVQAPVFKPKSPFTKINLDGADPLHTRDPETRRQLRFEQFVRDLLEGYPEFTNQYTYTHAYPLSRLLNTLKRLNLLPSLYKTAENWILPSIANITKTFPKFLAERCPQVESIPPMKLGGQHESSNDPLGTYRAAKNIWNKGGSVARALCHIHAFDYACFYGEAIPTGTTLGAVDIPEKCRDVYASDLFQKAILGS